MRRRKMPGWLRPLSQPDLPVQHRPEVRHDHRLKQHPRWHADQLPDGIFRWTTPSGRTYTTEPTRYPI